jgi:hypothetical protein
MLRKFPRKTGNACWFFTSAGSPGLNHPNVQNRLVSPIFLYIIKDLSLGNRENVLKNPFCFLRFILAGPKASSVNREKYSSYATYHFGDLHSKMAIPSLEPRQ